MSALGKKLTHKPFLKLSLFMGLLPSSAHAVTIGFESLEHTDSLITVSSGGSTYVENGFQITGGILSTFGTGFQNFTGSTALFDNDAGATIELTKIGGGTFDLISIDLAELNNASSAANVVFTRDGGHSQTFTLDGNAFETETFTFDNGFLNSTSVSWVQIPPFHQFDNIVIDTVMIPETSSTFVLAALMGLSVLHRKR